MSAVVIVVLDLLGFLSIPLQYLDYFLIIRASYLIMKN